MIPAISRTPWRATWSTGVCGGRGIKTVYTIARAVSYGMNITFAKQGYVYGGAPFQNTHISGSIENMNI